MSRENRILEKIEALERNLTDLKIELQKIDWNDNKRPKCRANKIKNKLVSRVKQHANKNKSVSLGDYIKILNPKKDQGTEGISINVNPKTTYVTVETSQGKVIRAQFNIEHIK